MKIKKPKVAETVSNKGKRKVSKKKMFESVVVTPEFMGEFYSYSRHSKTSGLANILNDRNLKLRTPQITARQINSWDSYELIEVDRDGKEWRKYSFLDAVWLNIVFELRKLGYTVQQLKLLKQSLQVGSKIIGTPMPFLEFCIYKAFMHNEEQVLLAFEDGSGIPINEVSYLNNIYHHTLENHNYIKLNKVIEHIFETNKNSLNENKALNFIRNNKFEKVSISFKSNEMEMITGTERINTNKYIGDVIKEYQHQTLEIKKNDGKLTNITRTVRKKIKDIEL